MGNPCENPLEEIKWVLNFSACAIQSLDRVRGSKCGPGNNMGKELLKFCYGFPPSITWCTGIHIKVAQAIRLRPPIWSGWGAVGTWGNTN